jgi:hypothetical protein
MTVGVCGEDSLPYGGQKAKKIVLWFCWSMNKEIWNMVMIESQDWGIDWL